MRLFHCQGDPDFYRNILEEYARSAGSKKREMESAFGEKDWKRYAISVHALKSISGTIGAESLRQAAAELETAARQENGQIIREKHGNLMKQYENAVRTIIETCGNEGAETTGSESETGAVLEFPPEDGA